MLEPLLGSRTRTRVLAILLLEPKGRFFVRELSRIAGVNVNAVRRELAILERLGLVRSAREGNLRYYSAEEGANIYPELRGMFLKCEGLVGMLREALSCVSGVESALVFGSYARGEATALSDVDLLVVGDVDDARLMRAVRGVEERSGREVNYVLMGPAEFEERRRSGDAFIRGALGGELIPVAGDVDGPR